MKGSHTSPTRCEVLRGLLWGGVYAIAGLILLFAVLAWSSSSFAYSWTPVSVTGLYPTSYASAMVVASTPVTLTMPSILTDWVGRVYYVECLSPLAHKIRIPGAYTWDGTNNVATCNSVAGAGFSFHVTGQLTVRVLESANIVWSLVI